MFGAWSKGLTRTRSTTDLGGVSENVHEMTPTGSTIFYALLLVWVLFFKGFVFFFRPNWPSWERRHRALCASDSNVLFFQKRNFF